MWLQHRNSWTAPPEPPNRLRFPWAYAEVINFDFQISFSFVFLICTVRTLMYITLVLQLVFDCSDDIRCVRAVAISWYGDVGRSSAPQPLEISLKKWLSLVNYVKMPASLLSLSFASSKKLPKDFCFQLKVYPQTKSKPFFSRSFSVKCYFNIFIVLLHVDWHCTKSASFEFLESGGHHLISLEPGCSLQDHNSIKQKNWVNYVGSNSRRDLDWCSLRHASKNIP